MFLLPESEPPSPLVSGIIDYNMPLTSTYLKQMKLRVMNSQEQVRCLVLALHLDTTPRLNCAPISHPLPMQTHWKSKSPLSDVDLRSGLTGQGGVRLWGPQGLLPSAPALQRGGDCRLAPGVASLESLPSREDKRGRP